MFWGFTPKLLSDRELFYKYLFRGRACLEEEIVSLVELKRRGEYKEL